MKRAKVVFLVNGAPGSPMDIRARSFAERLRGEFEIQIAYRSAHKVGAIFRFLIFLMRVRPALCYVLDMAFSGVLAAAFYRSISSCRVVVDTGDAIYELSRLSGTRSSAGVWLTKLLEELGLAISDRVVVRSHAHQELLTRQNIAAEVVPDAVDLAQYRPQAEPELRRQFGLEGFTSVGVLGSLIWNPRWQMVYGWDLIEAIHLLREQLRDLPVKGVIIGDGTGLAFLKKQCAAYGLEDRIVFVGRVPYETLPRYINMLDICLSTQSNDLAGQVRTTGKLPLYLACDRFVLASEVGEAARVLPPEMLVPYAGTKDEQYPERLAERIRTLAGQPERLNRHGQSRTIAQSHFDYDVLAARVGRTIQEILAPGLQSRERLAEGKVRNL
jgi:glycosyltransferase involved in cell wall biosynthesis